MIRSVAPLFVLLALSTASAGAQDLRLDYERESLIATYRHYTQYVDGVPVLGGEVIERITRDGNVRELHRAIAQPAPRRALIAQSVAREHVPAGAVGDSHIVAVNVGGIARPAWRIVVEEQPHEPVAHYVDAATGEVLVRQPLFARATAKARVFMPDPVTKLNDPSLRDQNDSAAAVPEAAYTLVDLLDIDPAGMLAGPNVRIVDDEAPATQHAEASQPLLFDRSQPQFEEVNAYFHIDRSQRYLQSLGYTGARRVVGYAIPVDPHAVSGSDNSLYLGSAVSGQGKLLFGDGGVDDAEDPDLVLHEYFHAVQDSIAPGVFFGSFGSQARALGEGFSDYWAYSSNYEAGLGSQRDPYCLAEWDARCAGDDPSQSCGYPAGAECLRRVDSTKTMSDFVASEAAGTEHRNGEIWSSALREIFDALVRRDGVAAGRREADTLVIESMFGAPANPTYALIARKLLDADRLLNAGVHVSTICSAFVGRQVLSVSDCDRAPRGEVTMFQSPQHGLAIPDDATATVSATVDVTDSRSIDTVAVSVNINHPQRGDLRVILTSPDGTSVILQNPSTDRAAATQVTYGIDAATVDRLDVFHGRSALGRWTLTVRDAQPLNAGTLLSWSLAITFAGDVPAAIRPTSFAPRAHIAAAAHAPGALGTSWQTDVRLFNGGASAANVTIVFTPAGQEGWNHFTAVKLAIVPKQIVALDDVVAATLFTSGIGALEFVGDVADVILTSRTYTRANGGTYGQFIPAVRTPDAVTIATVPQVQSTADFRTNVGFAEVTGNAATVRATLFDASTGAVVSQQDFDLVPFGQVQFPATGAALMTAELRVISGDARIVGYGSVVDNHTGDPIYVPAAAAGGGSFVAPVINQFGALNTFWRSDLFISAAGANGGAFTLTFVNARTGERITESGAIRDHRALRLQDVAGNLFGSAGAFGTVRADLPDGVVATSRTFTSASSGTFGQFIPLQHAEEGSAPLSPGGPARQLLHVERSASFRTNLGAINTGGSDALLRFTLYDAAGTTRGTVERTIAPLQAVQFPVDALSSDPLVAGRVEVQMISGSRGAIAWASVVDNVTGDPIFVPAQ